ncbi:TonB-dependent receptor [Nguyenibacter vanlangensis]|uniref:TonB-dependent receptor n=1 Tax=Nguyenibacter vanlangensis TaxID=1216886 RepID=A0ABZ3D9M0_9PROT
MALLVAIGASAKADTSTPVVPSKRGKAAASSQLRRPALRAAPRAATQPEEISVRAGVSSANGVTNTTPGGGLMPPQSAPKSISGITRDYIARQAPTANVQALIANLAGVVSGSQDPLGQTATQMSMRGLNETEIGFTYEGVQLADALTYEPYTQSMVDTDNIQKVDVAQGAPDLAAPVYNAVGGLINVELRHALQQQRVTTDFTFGSKSLEREFLRFDSGEIGHSGIKAFASFSSTSNNEWRGDGTFRKYHVDAELRKDWGRGDSAALIFSYDNLEQNLYRSVSMTQWRQSGTNFNYDGTYTPGDTNWVGLNAMHRRSVSFIAPVKLNLGRGFHLDISPGYQQYADYTFGGTKISNKGSFWGSEALPPLNLPYQTNGVTTAETVDTAPQQMSEINGVLSWKCGHNTARLGYNYSYLQMEAPLWYEAVGYNGSMANVEGRYPILLPNGGRYNTEDFNFKQQVNAAFLDDTIKLLDDRLTLYAGLRYMMISRIATNAIPGAIPGYRVAKNYAQPLPQVAISYQITPRDQIYINGSTAFRAPNSNVSYGNYFTTSHQGPATVPGNITGEYAISEELGYRHHGLVNVSAALFNYNLTHTQLTAQQYIGGILASSPVDGGGKTMRGAQLEVGMTPWHHFSPYLSGQYLHATMNNNFQVSPGTYLPTAGKIAVQSPEFVGALGLTYDDGHVFGNVTANYVGSQYASMMNDQKMPSREVGNASIGYRFASRWIVQHPQIQVNVINLGGQSYLSNITGVTTNARPVVATNGKVVAPGTAYYYIGGGLAVTCSLSAAF